VSPVILEKGKWMDEWIDGASRGDAMCGKEETREEARMFKKSNSRALNINVYMVT